MQGGKGNKTLGITHKKIIGRMGSNPASNTDQPERFYRLFFCLQLDDMQTYRKNRIPTFSVRTYEVRMKRLLLLWLNAFDQGHVRRTPAISLALSGPACNSDKKTEDMLSCQNINSISTRDRSITYILPR